MGNTPNTTGRRFGHFAGAAKPFGFVAVALLLMAGGRQDAEAELILSASESGGDLRLDWTGTLVMSNPPDVTNNLTAGRIWNADSSQNRSSFTRYGNGTNYDLWRTEFGGTLEVVSTVGELWSSQPSGFPDFFEVVSFGGDALGVYNRTAVGGSGGDWIYLEDKPFSSGDVLAFSGYAIYDVPDPSAWTLDPTYQFNFRLGGGPVQTISTSSVIPEPSSALALIGLVTSAFFRRRRRLLA